MPRAPRQAGVLDPRARLSGLAPRLAAEPPHPRHRTLTGPPRQLPRPGAPSGARAGTRAAGRGRTRVGGTLRLALGPGRALAPGLALPHRLAPTRRLALGLPGSFGARGLLGLLGPLRLLRLLRQLALDLLRPCSGSDSRCGSSSGFGSATVSWRGGLPRSLGPLHRPGLPGAPVAPRSPTVPKGPQASPDFPRRA